METILLSLPLIPFKFNPLRVSSLVAVFLLNIYYYNIWVFHHPFYLVTSLLSGLPLFLTVPAHRSSSPAGFSFFSLLNHSQRLAIVISCEEEKRSFRVYSYLYNFSLDLWDIWILDTGFWYRTNLQSIVHTTEVQSAQFAHQITC